MPRAKRTGETPLALVAHNVRRLREAMGISAWEVADQAGVTLRTLQKIEAGKSNITMETLAKLCVGLSADVTELFEAPPTRS